MTSLKNWFSNAIGHPITTAMGALPTIFAIVQWVFMNQGASNMEIVWAVASLLLGAAMTDPKK